MRWIFYCIVLFLSTSCSSVNTPRESNRGDEQAGEAADPEGALIDSDSDGIADEDDPCPEDASNADMDEDGICDANDACPNDPTESVDSDGDGVCDGVDDCPNQTPGYVDSNDDGICNDSDDTDGDGISDGEERIYGEDCGISNLYLADTDLDGIGDREDPYPRDPWPEFLLYRNDVGTIDLMLSNRDATFQEPVEVGQVFGGTGVHTYRYIQFAISDFDDNGRMDFLAIGDINPGDDNHLYDVWWFWRTKSDELQQRLLGQTDAIPFRTIADFDNDEVVDLLGVELSRPNYIESAQLWFYANAKRIATATCFVSDSPENEAGCAFVRREAVNITPWVQGQWSYAQARDAVDVNGDGYRDVAILRIASGGNSANVPIVVLYGRGDGTFDEPTEPLFSHNTATCGASPANSLLFADFDGDELGDIIAGLDDDGDAGSAWLYPGRLTDGAYDVDSSRCHEAFDINEADESGSEHAGVSTSARNFDVNFDGVEDVIVGYRYEAPWSGPSKTVILLGLGEGVFDAPRLVRDFPTTNYGNEFAVPKRVCARFSL